MRTHEKVVRPQTKGRRQYAGERKRMSAVAAKPILLPLPLKMKALKSVFFSLYINDLIESVQGVLNEAVFRWLHGLSQTKSFILQSFDTLATLSIFRILKVIIFCFNCKFMRRFFLFAIGTNYLTFIISFHNLSVL